MELNIFKKKLKPKGMYAVETGDKSGCFLVYIQEEDIGNSRAFLCMPYPLEAIYIDEKEVISYLDSKGLVFVEIIPAAVYDVCKGNFKYTKDKQNG